MGAGDIEGGAKVDLEEFSNSGGVVVSRSLSGREALDGGDCGKENLVELSDLWAENERVLNHTEGTRGEALLLGLRKGGRFAQGLQIHEIIYHEFGVLTLSRSSNSLDDNGLALPVAAEALISLVSKDERVRRNPQNLRLGSGLSIELGVRGPRPALEHVMKVVDIGVRLIVRRRNLIRVHRDEAVTSSGVDHALCVAVLHVLNNGRI
mmetsp:Transcript_6457/g.12787  ORF Transcript_6457/g.12787 Transcript_6457/m.12787 type:complete len:208 (+) Transcript_6457:4957-5580(+)